MTQLLHDPDAKAQLLADTYGDSESWQRVQDYRRVQAYKDQHPDAGSITVADALDFEQGYIHNWIYGSEPNACKGLRAADGLGWLDVAPGDRVFEAFVVLDAWILAGGSITRESWHPIWNTTGNRPVALLVDALEAVGSAPNHRQKRGGESDEVRVDAHASLLGRYLHGVLDAPVGAKIHTDLRVPAWLTDCPHKTRQRWARTYVCVRAGPISRETGIRIREANRPDGYHDALGALFRDVTDDADGMTFASCPLNQ